MTADPTDRLPPQRRRLTPLTVTLIVAIASLVGWSVWSLAHARSQARLAAGNAADIATQIRDACERDGETARELGDLCDRAVEVEEDPVVDPPLPSREQVRDAVENYLIANPPASGEPGRPGGAGRPPTDAEIDAAVARFCQGGFCRGDRGVPGERGEPGEDGEPGKDGESITGPEGPQGPPGETIVGPTGPGPTDAQVAAAVAAYCDAHGECRGEQGPQGEPGADSTEPGPQGEPGPTCPDGYAPQEHTVVTTGGPRTVLVCAATR